ncbi:threonine synthase [Streptomyces sp. RPT161]|uniref:threonine synthase n=1 Tax=Streptomyces sp. RPT161 TaxID=3015993 RepID=UPI0022B8C59B|nr:pyridoxal-phosphate dependent enzyme [Streptomyces sp. RPT161]
MTPGDSLANGQRSLGDPDIGYPLWPPLTSGCPRTSTDEVAYPLEVDYTYEKVDRALFTRPGQVNRGDGHDRWAPLLPPLSAPGLGEGGTPLVEIGDGVFIKDESRNPTWSHKDRLNRCTVSAAVGVGAEGIVVASSGNHGASAAAYAARAGLRCVVLGSDSMPPAVDSFLNAYGAVVLPVPQEDRWPLMRRLVDRLGLHPVSNLTVTHTGHPFGPEGYKTIAYEVFTELGVPRAVFVPTGYGELLYGVWKGFAELKRLGVAERTPRMFSCEPAAGGPLAASLRSGRLGVPIEVGPTSAYAIDCSVAGHRGVVAIRESGGQALLVSDEEMRSAQSEMARQGLWAEVSSAAALAGLRGLGGFDGPVVCVSTSSGFKDLAVGSRRSEPVEPTWEAVAAGLRKAGFPA